MRSRTVGMRERPLLAAAGFVDPYAAYRLRFVTVLTQQAFDDGQFLRLALPHGLGRDSVNSRSAVPLGYRCKRKRQSLRGKDLVDERVPLPGVVPPSEGRGAVAAGPIGDPAIGGHRAGPGGELAERVARVFSPDMRRTEARLGQLTGQLASLPELRATAFASRYGFRSETLVEQERPQWVQMDMERSYPIDCVVAVPAHIPAIRNRGEGYGFPLRFRI
jgi:hypothetical protein